MEKITVKDVMREEPVAVSPRMTLNHAASLMREKGISSLIVVRKNTPVGIVTEKDIVTKAVAENIKPSQMTIKQIMSYPLETASPSDDIKDVARKMADMKIRRLVVVENGMLIGIICETDILRISPTLIEITREYAKINGSLDEKLTITKPLTGYCESCESYSEELYEVNGMLLCKYCREYEE